MRHLTSFFDRVIASVVSLTQVAVRTKLVVLRYLKLEHCVGLNLLVKPGPDLTTTVA